MAKRARAQPSSLIRVGVSPTGGGRGVFAAEEIAPRRVIEVAPVIVVPRPEAKWLHRTRLETYVFRWGGGCLAVALGCGSLYNHSYTPNARYWQDTANQAFEFVALRHIRRGEEITINYNGDPEGSAPLWFDVAE